MKINGSSFDLIKLQTNLTILNQILMHLEFEENGITLPAFSKTNIEPHWLELYKFTPQQLEYSLIYTMLNRADLPNDKDSVRTFLEEIQNDPQAYWNAFNEDTDYEQEESHYLEQFNSLSEEERSKEIESQAIMFHISMALSFNYISQMMNGLNIQELLYSKEKLSHQDIYSLVKVDKCLICHDKVKKVITNQQFDGNTIFFESLARSLRHVKFKTDKKFPRVYYALSILEYEGYIHEGRVVRDRCTADQLLSMLFEAGFYYPKRPTNNVKKFRELLKKYHDDRKHRLNPHNKNN